MFLSKLPERKHILHVLITPLKYSQEILEIFNFLIYLFIYFYCTGLIMSINYTTPNPTTKIKCADLKTLSCSV